MNLPRKFLGETDGQSLLKMSTWWIWMSSFQSLISNDFPMNLTDLVWWHLLTTGIQKAFWCHPQTHGPSELTDHPYHTRSGDHKNGGVWGRLTHTKYRYPRKFRKWYFVSPDTWKLYPSHMKIVWGSAGSGGGDPYHTVRILCESGVRKQILESGLGNLNANSFALLLVQFADPDHVRIRN
jgi:hypothetical protein